MRPIFDTSQSMSFRDSVVTTSKVGISFYTQGILTARKRVTLMVITITVIFGICWVPDIIIHSIDYYTSLSISQPVYAVIHTLVLFNSTVNPFVYALISQTFREKLRGMICCRFTSTKGFWSTISRKSTRARNKSSESGRFDNIGPVI